MVPPADPVAVPLLAEALRVERIVVLFVVAVAVPVVAEAVVCASVSVAVPADRRVDDDYRPPPAGTAAKPGAPSPRDSSSLAKFL